MEAGNRQNNRDILISLIDRNQASYYRFLKYSQLIVLSKSEISCLELESSMLVTISLHAQRKLDYLDLDSRRKFLNIIYNFIQRQLAGNQARKLTGHNNLIRIRYNLDYRIITAFVNTQPETQFRVLDFVSHDEMDRKQYFDQIDSNYEPVSFDELSISDEFPQTTLELEKEINQASLWQTEDQLKNIIHYNLIEDDFYLYRIATQEEQILDLSLSPEQYQVVEQQLPIFLAGSAGSGKTTIALYHAIQKTLEIQQNQSEKTVAYITYNQHLKEYAERIIQQIDTLANFPNLKLFDYNSLCRHLGSKESYFPESCRVTQQKFIQQFFQSRPSQYKRGIDPIALWQEIRHLIKGSVQDCSNKIISKEDYRQRCRNFRNNWEKVYELAEQYQKWLNNKNYWDEIDLTHTLLKYRDSHKYEYNFVYCDEIQDLTEIQIHFVLTLLQYPYSNEFPNFFLTGDTAQIINPSGFSWDKVKTILHYNYAQLPNWKNLINQLDQPQKLSLNFRSQKQIVELNNQILQLNQENRQAQIPFRQGQTKPLVISNLSQEEFLYNRDIFGPNNAIITVNQEEKEKLVHHFSKDNIRSERVLTISEAKGLEFDEVLVWNFFSSFESWGSHQKKNLGELEKFKYNCLYVCGTRARNHLYFYEETPAQFWEKPELENYIQHSSNQLDVERFFNPNITPADWRQAGQNLEEQGAYQQARENYLRGGWNNDARRVEAKYYEQEGDYNQATEIWFELAEIERAIQALEAVGNYQKIAELEKERGNVINAALAWENAENYPQAASLYQENARLVDAERCWEKAAHPINLAQVCEQQQKWLKAADTWQQIAEVQRAASCYEKAHSWGKAEQCWRTLENWEKVAQVCEQQQKWLEAAEAWQQARKPEKAAQSCEKGEYWLQAIPYWQQSDNTYQIALMHQRCAGETWEHLQEQEKAAQAYEYGEYWHKAEQLWIELENWYHLAQVYEKQGKWKDAAEQWYFNLEQTKVAAQAYTQGEYYLEAEQCWRELEAWDQVAKACEKQNTPQKWQEAGQIWKDLEHWQQAGNAFQQAQLWEEAGECWERAKNWEKAELCWERAGNRERLAIACEKQNKFLKAARLWEELRAWGKAAKAWEKAEQTEAAAQSYERDKDWRNAERCWLKLEKWESVAVAREKQEKWEPAGDAWQQISEIQNAGNCYEKGKNWNKAERCWETLENWQKLAQVCKKQQKYLKAAQTWEKVPNFAQAGECYEKALDWENAERCWRKVNDKFRIAYVCDQQNKWADSAPLWEELRQWEKAAIAYRNLGHLEKAARYFKTVGEQHHDKEAWKEAAQIWHQLGNKRNSQEFLTRAAEAYEIAHCGMEAAKIWRQLGRRLRALWATGKQEIF